MAVVVDALKRVSLGRGRSEVGKESLERCAPFIADAYAAPTVPIKSSAVGVVAPLDHSVPDPVFAMIVFWVWNAIHFATEAAATTSATASQVQRGWRVGLAARAFAQPTRFRFTSPVKGTEHGQASECLAGEIKFSHKEGNPGFSADWLGRHRENHSLAGAEVILLCLKG